MSNDNYMNIYSSTKLYRGIIKIVILYLYINSSLSFCPIHYETNILWTYISYLLYNLYDQNI